MKRTAVLAALLLVVGCESQTTKLARLRQQYLDDSLSMVERNRAVRDLGEAYTRARDRRDTAEMRRDSIAYDTTRAAADRLRDKMIISRRDLERFLSPNR